MTSSTVYPNIGRLPRPAACRIRAAPAWVAVLGLGCASCSQSDSFLGAQIDYQLRQQTPPTLDLAKVGPATWTRVCVLGPGTDDRAAQALLGLPWPASRLTSLGETVTTGLRWCSATAPGCWPLSSDPGPAATSRPSSRPA